MNEPTPAPAPAPLITSAEGFGSALLEMAGDALPYIAAGLAAGVVVLAVMYGVRRGLTALRTVGK